MATVEEAQAFEQLKQPPGKGEATPPGEVAVENPATGQTVNPGVMVIARFDEAGKWVEDWANWDQLGLLQQLGVIPAPAAA